MKRLSLPRSVVLCTLAAGFVSCSGAGNLPDEALANSSIGESRVADVTAVAPRDEPLAIEITAPGSFVAYEEATLSTEGTGTVAEIRVKEGSRVNRGDPLILLNRTKAELGVEQAEAGLAQALANFERAKSELARKEILLADRTIPQGTFDTFKAQYDGAAAAVQGAESALALARERLQDATVVAPFSGVIKEKRTAIGEYVRSGDPLLVLIQIDPLKLQFEVPEKHAARLSAGQEVRTSVSALPGETFTGEITTIFPALAVQSRTIRVEASVPNPSHRLKPGFFASVQVPLTSVPGALVIPRNALFRREGTENVFVTRDGRAERVVVGVGGETTDEVEILSGLTVEDRVIVSGVETLRAGDPVNVTG